MKYVGVCLAQTSQHKSDNLPNTKVDHNIKRRVRASFCNGNADNQCRQSVEESLLQSAKDLKLR